MSHPWIRLYPEGVDPEPRLPSGSLVDAWRARVAAHPDGVALRYFDGVLTAADVDEESDALAVALLAKGVRRGDRVGIYLQNIPQYAISMLALWKIGAAALLLNPMYRGRELRHLVEDAGAVGMICADTTAPETAETLRGTAVGWLITTSDLHYQSRNDPRVFAETERAAVRVGDDFTDLVARHRGARPPQFAPGAEDLAIVAYTSGTTGAPKGSRNSHANVLAVARTYGDFVGIADGDVVFAVAPLFHITGAVINATVALIRDCALVFGNRFHPEVTLEAFVEHGVTFTIGSITVFNALYRVATASAEHFASVKTLYSGGAPIPPATVRKFEDRFGHYIHNAFGMTETSSGVVAVPPGVRAPVDAESGSLAIGIPLPLVEARVVDESGDELPYGTPGELELAGPQIISGYLGRPDDTAKTFPGGRLRTGDVAIMDEDGWIHLVDRLKDQINVSGYKVWPREVESALHEHPGVYEAGVTGEPDDYQGERVVAYVALTAGARVTEQELVAFVGDRLAAYKRPRRVHIVDAIPKTLTGKIRRTELRTPSQA
ncbi:class I adenylate-forming enzyme family protein [Rhodococcus sp. SGAir0479]|uniref:class I adenylate-forming enzyme family protein n=1 Tax=Rhodococcus sp. SGAir0479 TaxID=2567884 RepID=UPI0010CCEECA|nr:AMP-binding protein [Rhodococcus sp. SGAir0479]QCQ92749.1 long-chain fatty acid--CoA ligase [Rhodococcus sp. SGAir0479]